MSKKTKNIDFDALNKKSESDNYKKRIELLRNAGQCLVSAARTDQDEPESVGIQLLGESLLEVGPSGNVRKRIALFDAAVAALWSVDRRNR